MEVLYMVMRSHQTTSHRLRSSHPGKGWPPTQVSLLYWSTVRVEFSALFFPENPRSLFPAFSRKRITTTLRMTQAKVIQFRESGSTPTWLVGSSRFPSFFSNLFSQVSELYVFTLANSVSPLRISKFWRRYKHCRSLLRRRRSLGLSCNLPAPSMEAKRAAAQVRLTQLTIITL